jgi:hypothetical protein
MHFILMLLKCVGKCQFEGTIIEQLEKLTTSFLTLDPPPPPPYPRISINLCFFNE